MSDKDVLLILIFLSAVLAGWVIYLLHRVSDLKLDIKGYDKALMRCTEENQKLEIKKTTLITHVRKGRDGY